MERVGAGEIQQVVIDQAITEFPLQTACHRCQEECVYEFTEDGEVYFRSGCTGRSDISLCDTPSRRSSFEAVAVSFNRLDPQGRRALWDQFIQLGSS